MRRRVGIACLLILHAGFARGQQPAKEKPPLTAQDLEKFTRYFDIVNGKLVGDGAILLIEEFKRSQYVLLGEYHNSPLISQFVKAAIPELHAAGFRSIGLEVGPVTAKLLAEMSRRPESTTARLNLFNTRYHQDGRNIQSGRTYTSPAIPFFSNVEDADFLAELSRRHWSLFGFDQEFITEYLPLVDRMLANLTPARRKALQPQYNEVIRQLRAIYTAYSQQDGPSPAAVVYDSKEMAAFLAAASVKRRENTEIAEAIRKTTEIYRYGSLRQYTTQNTSRIDYMHKLLARDLRAPTFDLAKDRMVLKMGAVHTARGFSVIYQYEIGNTLSELASFHGNRSLHIRFNSRYSAAADGTVTDEIDSPSQRRYQPLLQMGQKDRWVVIDLRAMRDDVFMRDRWKLDDFYLMQVFQSQDLYIIAPTERGGTPNLSRGL